MLTRDKFIVHIVDDDDSTRAALVRIVKAAGFEVQSFSSAGAYLAARPDDRPFCLLLDLEMPEVDGLALQQALLWNKRTNPIIFMSAYADVSRAVHAIKAGAVEFLTKPIATDLLLSTLDKVMHDVGQHLENSPAVSVPLTERERQVLHYILNGYINKTIADKLGLSERTIKLCRAELMTKLGASSMAELIKRGTALTKNTAGII